MGVHIPCNCQAGTSNSQFKTNDPSTTKIRQIILNLPDFFFYSLDEPVILSVTDQRRDTTKVPGGGRGKSALRQEGLLPPDRTPEKFLWCPFAFHRVN
jgi:hypothetical protein